MTFGIPVCLFRSYMSYRFQTSLSVVRINWIYLIADITNSVSRWIKFTRAVWKKSLPGSSNKARDYVNSSEQLKPT
jgi:hypothetical protein